VRWGFDLDIATSSEVNLLAFRKFKYEFFNEGGNVAVRFDFATPLFRLEDFRRYFDLHVLLNGDLAGQATALASILLIDVSFFGSKDFSAACKDIYFALSAGSASAAGR